MGSVPSLQLHQTGVYNGRMLQAAAQAQALL